MTFVNLSPIPQAADLGPVRNHRLRHLADDASWSLGEIGVYGLGGVLKLIFGFGYIVCCSREGKFKVYIRLYNSFMAYKMYDGVSELRFCLGTNLKVFLISLKRIKLQHKAIIAYNHGRIRDLGLGFDRA